MKVWLCFDFGTEQHRFNMASKNVAAVCDDLSSCLCDGFIELFVREQKTGEAKRVNIFTVNEAETSEEFNLLNGRSE